MTSLASRAYVVQSLQEQEDDDAHQSREAVEGLFKVLAAAVLVEV